MPAITFDDDEDFDLFYDHCKDLIVNRENTNLAQHADSEAMQELLDELDQWYADFEETGAKPDSLEAGEFWETLISNYEDNHAVDEWKNPDSKIVFSQGHSKAGDPIGYSDKLMSSQLLSQKSLIKHRYSRYPEALEWNLRLVEQHGETAFIGAAPICEIDAVSSVPWLDPSMQSHDFGRRTLDSEEMRNEWQRVVDIDRIGNIKGFANDISNSLFNPIILYADTSHESVQLIQRGNKANMKIDFEFLRRRGFGGFTDYIVSPNEEDLRPLWIIDGQHRTRGFAISENSYDVHVPIVIIPGDGTESKRTKVAKIFTEINTEGVPVEEMHQIFLRYKFKMKGGRSDNFELNEEGAPTTGQTGSRPNVRAYELALKLASDNNSPLYNTIQFQKPPKKKDDKRKLITVKTWMDKVTKWFRNDKLYLDVDSDSYHVAEVNNFFIAFAENSNKTQWPCPLPSGWRNKNNRWENPPGRSNSKPLIQQVGPFTSLIELYSELLEYIVDKMDGINRPISVTNFKQIMSPIKNIDWLDPTVRRKLKGRQSNVKYLTNFMITSIKDEGENTAEEILKEDLPSTAGKGLLSKPSRRDYSHKDDWFHGGQAKFTMPRPLHAQKAGWIVQYYKRGESVASKLNVPKGWQKLKNDSVTLTIKKSDVSDDAQGATIEKIVVQGCWTNELGDSPYSKHTMNNPR